MEISTFTCTICGESSRDICVYCTKDACSNHLCEKCRRCSDCCACEMRFTEFDGNGVSPYLNGIPHNPTHADSNEA